MSWLSASTNAARRKARHFRPLAKAEEQLPDDCRYRPVGSMGQLNPLPVSVTAVPSKQSAVLRFSRCPAVRLVVDGGRWTAGIDRPQPLRCCRSGLRGEGQQRVGSASSPPLSADIRQAFGAGRHDRPLSGCFGDSVCARASGYVCWTLRPVIDDTIFLMRERQQVAGTGR